MCLTILLLLVQVTSKFLYEWRRNKVRELNVKGYTQRRIASILKVAYVTVNDDLQWMRQEAKEGISRYIDEYLPAEYEACLLGFNEIMQKAWELSESADENVYAVLALKSKAVVKDYVMILYNINKYPYLR
jgi:hypothetical protein